MKTAFTRAEVLALLKKQIKASANSYGRMNANPQLMRNEAWQDDNIKTHSRLAKVKPVKF